MAARLPTLLEHEAYDDERLPPEIRRKSSEAMLNVDELELKEEVGRGGFSQVYRAVYKGTEVAVKKMPLVDKDAAKYLDSEIAILKCVLQRCSACRCGRCVALGRSWLADTLRAAWFVSVVSGCRNTSHPSLIKYYGAAIKGKEVYIVTEFMNGGGGCFLMVLATRGYEVPRILLRERLPSPTYSRVLAQHRVAVQTSAPSCPSTWTCHYHGACAAASRGMRCRALSRCTRTSASTATSSPKTFWCVRAAGQRLCRVRRR